MKFPHHENELAQTCAACEDGGVNYWLHNGHVTINNEKMAKSKKNFKTIREVCFLFVPNIVKAELLTGSYLSFFTICVDDRKLPSTGSEALLDECALPVSSELLSVTARQFL